MHDHSLKPGPAVFFTAVLIATIMPMLGCSRAVTTVFAAPRSGATSTSSPSAIEIDLQVPAFSSDPAFSVSATAHGHASIVEMKLYLDGVLSAHSGWGQLSARLEAGPGDHSLTLRASDTAGHAAEKSARVTIADPMPRGKMLLAQLH